MEKKPRSARVTLKDVAEVLGVSAMAVSYALNGRGTLSANLRDKIKKTAAAMGYSPNPAARMLRGTKTKSIGVVINFFNNPFFLDFFIGLEEITAAAGISYWVSQTSDVLEKEKIQVRTLAEFGVDGLILLPCSDEFAHLEAVTAQFDAPVLLISHNMGNRFASVQADNVRGGMLATEHLLELGDRPILHIAGPLGKSGMRERRQGFCQAMEAARLDFSPDGAVFFVDSLTSAEGGRIMGEILRRYAPPVGVFVTNDDVALGVLTYCREQGLRLPDDVAVVGFSDIDILTRLDIPLSSIHVPQKLMGRTAGRILLDLIDNPELRNDPPVVTMPVSLVVRQSTAAAKR